MGSRFKAVFDKYLKTIHKKKSNSKVFEDCETGIENSKTTSTEPGRKNLPHSIGLKQLGRSIKYMTAAEKREEQKKKAKEAAKIKRAATLAAKNISKDTPAEKTKILAKSASKKNENLEERNL